MVGRVVVAAAESVKKQIFKHAADILGCGETYLEADAWWSCADQKFASKICKLS